MEVKVDFILFFFILGDLFLMTLKFIFKELVAICVNLIKVFHTSVFCQKILGCQKRN
jgi:hypothetical protein